MLHTVSIQDGRVVIPKQGKKIFTPNVSISQEQFEQCLDFASLMAYGDKHNSLAFGSTTYDRTQENIFKNALQGKIAELGFYNFYTNKGVSLSRPDFGVWDKGVWEDCDICVNGKKISIKSTKHIGNLLMLETDRYSQDGLYLEPADGDIPIKHDLIYLVRVQGIDYARAEHYDTVGKIKIEISGYITHEDFLEIITSNMIIKKGNRLGRNGLGISMIVDNYYICCGDLKSPVSR